MKVLLVQFWEYCADVKDGPSRIASHCITAIVILLFLLCFKHKGLLQILQSACEVIVSKFIVRDDCRLTACKHILSYCTSAQKACFLATQGGRAQHPSWKSSRQCSQRCSWSWLPAHQLAWGLAQLCEAVWQTWRMSHCGGTPSQCDWDWWSATRGRPIWQLWTRDW